MLILRLPRYWWSLPLVGEEEDDGCGGGALGAPLWVALLLVRSRGGWNGMECLVIDLGSSPLLGSTLSPI